MLIFCFHCVLFTLRCACNNALCVLRYECDLACMFDAHTRAQSGYTALIRATENGHVDCVRLLLDAGADKNAKDVVRDCFAVSAAVRVFVLVLDAW